MEHATHTPDRIHNPTCACTCHVEFKGKAHRIIYCPTHAAAPELLKACESALVLLDRQLANAKRNDAYGEKPDMVLPSPSEAIRRTTLRQAIRKAKGEA